jgi:D-glycero-D-manno-heptose 1,7-bisphosphate phosphatase
MLNLHKIDKSWTLFLDRDGVINIEKYQDYIYNYDEFVFYDGVLKALKIFNNIFGTIILATNQRGVNKGLMTEKDLQDIHTKMLADIKKAGGRMDAIYYCLALDNEAPCRKPNAGMALQAQQDFKHINFSKSIMVGNNISDMNFGRNAGMHTAFVKTTHPAVELPHPAIDKAYNSLLNFAEALTKA